jgi:hypothetical protein
VMAVSGRILAILVFSLVVVGLPLEAGAAVIDVRPGPNAITKAVHRADPGDRVVIHGGLYREQVVVGKRLSLMAPRETLPRSTPPAMQPRPSTSPPAASSSGGCGSWAEPTTRSMQCS